MAVVGRIYSLLCKYRDGSRRFPTIEYHYLSSPTEDLDFGIYNFVVYIPENGLK
jgi:hypothetical protein